jgi:hypothetical protein
MLILAYCAISLDTSNQSSYYFLSPGNLLTRLIPVYPEYFSHILEPFYLILIIICEYLSSRKCSAFRLPARISFLTAWLLEILHFYRNWNYPIFLIQLLWASSFILYSLAILSNEKESKLRPPFLKLTPIILVIVGLVTPFIPQEDPQSIKATHYYLWFPENWKAGYGTNQEDKTPSLGEYDSENIGTIRSHLKEISDQGISLLIIDWWPKNPILKRKALRVIKILKEFPELKFSIHLETLQLGLDKNSDLMTLDEARTTGLKKSFEYAGRKLFKHKQYFHIDSQPTVFMYASRHLVGNVQSALHSIREHTKEITGKTPYIIGDEAFYQVPEGRNSEQAKLLPNFIPSWERLKAFDAITLYNPYDPTHHYESLENNDISDFLIESQVLYEKYKNISDHLGIPFFPTVIPSYNDKAIRPHLNHQIIPRTDTNSVSTLESLLKITDQYKHNRHGPNILIITSFNEWNEGSNIEK